MIKLIIFLALCQLSIALFFPSVSPSGGCGCGCAPPPPTCGGCCGGRKKRDVGHVKGHMMHREDMEEWNNQCNSQEFSEVIMKHLNLPTMKQCREAIYKELDAAYPDSMLTVFCAINATSSYQADAKRYCMEAKNGRSCHVFEF